MGTHLLFCRFGGARTLDPMIKSHVLYQLSYEPNDRTHKGSYFPRTTKFRRHEINMQRIIIVIYRVSLRKKYELLARMHRTSYTC